MYVYIKGVTLVTMLLVDISVFQVFNALILLLNGGS